MRICGVELTGSEAIICLLSKDGQMFDLPDCRARKFTLPKEHNQEDLQKFQFEFGKLMQDYQVDKVAIKERPTKGKFAGSAAGFKMEAAIQLIADLQVILFDAAQIKELLKQHPLPIEFAETGLKQFQQGAFVSAYVAHYFKGA
ncbi:DUF3010 family protein [Agaribacterium haliotis]|uniref:DUF3010 family protein n=1 Tax=Agaribacterium haliotis TaxID=2013869 RepID=UPI000BB560CC|nr:DUF3010 family protein [Agaribacterium haliotis]